MHKKVNRIQPKSEKRSQKKHKPWIVHVFNQQCCVAYITGLYSCQWKIEQEGKSRRELCCCSSREQLFYPFLVISFCMSVVLLFVWIETSNEYFDFDWVIFLGTRYWFFWSLLLLSLFGILTAYSSLLLVLGFLLIWKGNELYLHCYHKKEEIHLYHFTEIIKFLAGLWQLAALLGLLIIAFEIRKPFSVAASLTFFQILTLLVILICTCFLLILCIYWKEKWLTVGLSLKVFAPYMHLSSITVMVIVSWPVAFYLIHLEQEAVQVAIGLPFFLILLCLYVLPLGFYSPCIQEKDKLGPKPDIFGHKGAPMLGPENTMMSFEKAVENGAFGLESNIYLSYDEVPFLMHDNNLRRTTNIREVMPNASFRHSSLFTWNFLSTLNAGKWFVQFKPFYNMKPLSEADKEKARNQMIPKLSDLLEFAQKEKKFVIFDLNIPPPKHPLRKTFVRRVVSVILDSQIEQHLIYWLTAFDRMYVKKKAPGFQQVGRLYSIERLTKENISKINVDYKKLFYNGLRDYKAANININLYIVNEPWLYSLAWCSRIHSVTTDNIQLLRQINHPYFFMTPSHYMLMWFLLDGVSAVFIVSIFYFHWWKENKENVSESSSSHTDTDSINLEKGKSDHQKASNLSIKPPSRVLDSPWTRKAIYPRLPNSSISNYPGPRQFLVAPKKIDSKPEPDNEPLKSMMPAKVDVRQLTPSEASELILAPTREATREPTLQTALPALTANEPTISSIEVLHPETQHQSTFTVEPFPRNRVSTTSDMSLSSSGFSPKKN